jgi:hypothetical protein
MGVERGGMCQSIEAATSPHASSTQRYSIAYRQRRNVRANEAILVSTPRSSFANDLGCAGADEDVVRHC